MKFPSEQLNRCVAAARRFTAVPGFRVLTGVLTVVVVVLVALNSSSQFTHLGEIGSIAPAFLAVAIVAEIASLLAYAVMVRELLQLGRVSARVGALLRPTLAGIAMGASLPGGVGASNVYWYRRLRQHGADRGLAALVLTGTSVAGALSLFGLLVVGAAAAGDAGPLARVHVWVLGVGAAVLVLRLVFAHRLGRLLTEALRRMTPMLEARRRVRVRRLHRTMVLAYANWIFDCLALYACLHATHTPVPFRSVILVYALSQLVANSALLPGGGGTVELSLVAGFSTFVDHSGALLAGVLLYRFVNCWGLIPVGWLAVMFDPARRANRRCQGDDVVKELHRAKSQTTTEAAALA